MPLCLTTTDSHQPKPLASGASTTLPTVIVGSPNVNTGYQLVNNAEYPAIAKDFAETFRVLKSLKCDIFLGAHGSYYGLDAKYPKLKPGATNPFVDPDGYRAYITEREQHYLKVLKEQGQ